jgi:hypothetical protein
VVLAGLNLVFSVGALVSSPVWSLGAALAVYLFRCLGFVKDDPEHGLMNDIFSVLLYDVDTCNRDGRGRVLLLFATLPANPLLHNLFCNVRVLSDHSVPSKLTAPFLVWFLLPRLLFYDLPIRGILQVRSLIAPSISRSRSL